MKYTFTREDLYKMEKRILTKVQYRVNIPTRYQFAFYYAHHLSFSSKQRSLLLFLLSLSFLDFNLNYELMSCVAASAVYLTLQVSDFSLSFLVFLTDVALLLFLCFTFLFALSSLSFSCCVISSVLTAFLVNVFSFLDDKNA
jgi:hypothetical protein